MTPDRRATLGVALAATLAAAGCVMLAPPTPLPPDELPAAPAREFRGAWVATVANIDWPSRPGLPAATQRDEALFLLDRAAATGLNAIVLQVRTACDALYASELEPWSEYLTGTQGQAPGYDPLAFWVAEAHRRGLELHAWFNPYRARHPSARAAAAPSHVSNVQPAITRRYGDMLWLDPGEGAAMAHTLAVIADVVRRYDIDGVHIDDYFYPYPMVGPAGEEPFPDDAPWRRYTAGGGRLARDDWRRDNVDRLVQALYTEVHRIKPWVRVGISPFGLGRPDRRPPGIVGFSQYDKLYADVERWFAEGWLDYLAPQLYWPIERPAQAFVPLLDYWIAQNSRGRHLWPGLFTSSIGHPERDWAGTEVLNQVALLRTRPAAAGHIHFSMIALGQDRDGVAGRLAVNAYAGPALVPATPWLGAQVPSTPLLRREGTRRVRIESGDDADADAAAARWAVWRRTEGHWRLHVQSQAQRAIELTPPTDAVAVQAIGRTGIAGALASLKLT